MVLTESYAVGPSDPPIRDLTIGGVLPEVAAAVPDSTALVAGVPNTDARRQWTYAELLNESTRAAGSLQRGD